MLTQRSYKDENDKLAMAELARTTGQTNLHFMDLPYRLSSWALDEPHNVRIWEDDHHIIVAWAVLQTPFWALDYAIHPSHTALLPSLLSWADIRAKEVLNSPYGHPCWFVNIFSDQRDQIHQLEEAGYACQAEVGEDSWSKVWMRRPGSLPVEDYPIPPGFTVRTLAGANDLSSYVELHQAVFETKNMTFDWRNRTLLHPDYTPNLDVIVTSPDGRLAAFCVAWLCRLEGEEGVFCAQIEPLGCHADYRRYALGRFALAEILRRLQAYNIQDICVETDSYRDTAFRLYESMGFEVIREVLVYRKDFG